jgi:outer membrane PBP1 activator LpoA protein
MHPELNSRIKLLGVAIGLIFLTSCASTPRPHTAEVEARDIVATEAVIEKNQIDDDTEASLGEAPDTRTLRAEDIHRDRARYFNQQSQNQIDRAAQVDSALSSAEYYIQAQDFPSAARAATQLYDDTLSNIQKDRLTVINAYIAHANRDYFTAISLLRPLWSRLPEPTEPEPIEPETTEFNTLEEGSELAQISIPEFPELSTQQIDALLLASFSYQALGDYESALGLLITRERSLTGSARSETTRYIWQVIRSVPMVQRQSIFERTQNLLVRNRIEQSLSATLAPIARAPQQFGQWHKESKGKEKQTLNQLWTPSSPRDIAVLLPITSKFNKAALAVKDGINYQHEANLSPYRPQIRFYDIGDAPYAATQYYTAALQSGADFVIGPLGKDYANQISRYLGHRPPTLLLGGDTPLDTKTSRFTMSPEMEGARVAERAWSDGHLSAALVITDTPASRRTVNAFNQKWHSLGGKVSKTVFYSAEQFDHSVELKELFDINQSHARHNKISEVLDFKPKFSAYLRSDIDFIFMIANTDAGRLIRPQVNFFSGSKVPVYSTSSIFNGIQDEVNNFDLNATQFPVMPWVLKSEQVAPYAGQLNMLFALGSDAYSIAASFQELRRNSNLAINGSTGQVSINNDGEASYQPVWATFNDGLVVPIETLGLDISPLSTPNHEPLDNLNVKGTYNDSTYNSQTWDRQNDARKKGQGEYQRRRNSYQERLNDDREKTINPDTGFKNDQEDSEDGLRRSR